MPKVLHYEDSYYEAILQLRPKNEALISFCLNQIQKNNIKIARKVELKTGIDLYLSSRKFGAQLLRKLKKSFKGTSKVSKTIHTKNRQTSKNVYRVTFLFKKQEDL